MVENKGAIKVHLIFSQPSVWTNQSVIFQVSMEPAPQSRRVLHHLWLVLPPWGMSWWLNVSDLIRGSTLGRGWERGEGQHSQCWFSIERVKGAWSDQQELLQLLLFQNQWACIGC